MAVRARVAVLLTVVSCSPSGTGSTLLDDVERIEAPPGAPAVQDGELPPLGPRVHASGLELRVFSSRATRIEVELYAQARGAGPILRVSLQRDRDRPVWRGEVTRAELTSAALGPEILYGLRAWGPNWVHDPTWAPGSSAGFLSDVDLDGNRFNPNKLLIDPWAHELSHDPWYEGMPDARGYLSGAEHRDRDTGAFAPKSIALPDAQLAPVEGKPTRPLREELIYEVHLRGLTRNDPAVPEACRGTYRGAALKADYLRDLGVTAVELLPVQETANDANDQYPAADDNYWGYSTLALFAPDRRYACDRSPGGPTRELRELVAELHRRGIKVYLDVVYNHTGEGGAFGKARDIAQLLSWRGLDNAAYYQLGVDPWDYRNDNGVSPNLNVTSAASRALILDSLRHWTERIGVDGFRFDLAAVLGNGCGRHCFRWEADDPRGVLRRIAAELPARPEDGGPGVDLIAEPWGVTPGTYQGGRFPPGWAEWNDGYRDTVRRHQNRADTEPVSPRDLLQRLLGSRDRFGDDGRAPWSSINYIVSHDGFTLRDLYSCAQKNNQQGWPYGPSAGGEDDNRSWDQGGDPALQRQAARTGLALLATSAGVPMIVGGDEMYRTQYCNNNPYNVDSIKNWLDWQDAQTHAPFHLFARRLFQLRRAHPALRPARWLEGRDGDGDGLDDVTFLTATGARASEAYLSSPESRFVAWRLDADELGDPSPSIYVAYNGSAQLVAVTLPPPSGSTLWHRALDTAAWMEERANSSAAGEEDALKGARYDLHPRSVVVLIER